MLIALDPTKREREKKNVEVHHSNLRIQSRNRNKLKVKFTWELKNISYAANSDAIMIKLFVVFHSGIVDCAMCDMFMGEELAW